MHNTQQKPEESLVESRIDHYQTPTEVRVSIFAKQADQTRSTVVLEEDKVQYSASSVCDLYAESTCRSYWTYSCPVERGTNEQLRCSG